MPLSAAQNDAVTIVVMSTLPVQFLLLTLAGWMTRDHQRVTAYLLAENAVLREHLRGQRLLFSNAQRRRLASAASKLGRKALEKLDTLVTPDTLFRWYRRLVACKYDSTARRSRSQPARTTDIVQLVRRMANDNPSWGYTRIRGALRNIGHDIGRNTIKRILHEAGFTPAPERRKRMSWSAFLRAHWGAIAAMDFFTVEAVTWAGLVRYHVLIVIDLATRRVEIAGIVHQPHGAWMQQVARNLTDVVDVGAAFTETTEIDQLHIGADHRCPDARCTVDNHALHAASAWLVRCHLRGWPR